ncbi:MAG TPA: efflux RND transporter periplasmic adaptor subunit [Burkholderiales bacterium]|nr:efflux RND transporter periplasmic adaptor subunit [Burkholderiales bacterium]
MRLAVALLLFALAPAFAQQPGKPSAALPVKAVPAKLARTVIETGAIGTLRADEAVMIRPEIAGRIDRIAFDEGQRVKKGALLATLDAAETRALVASSRAQAGLDKQRMERAADLQKKGFISQQALDEMQSNYARSAAKLREDEAKLAKSEIRAPFSGVAGLRQVSEGAYVAAGTDIARLEKIDQLKLDFRVPETYLAQLKSGLAVSIGVDAFPQASFPGSIYAIEPAVDEQTRTVLARARVANPQLRLRPGMFARVQLTLGVRENAVWIPEEAIVPRGQDSFVWRVTDGKAELVPVQTGTRKVGEVEIMKGVAAGDIVVTEGSQRLVPGMQVSIIPSAKPAAAIPGKKGG